MTFKKIYAGIFIATFSVNAQAMSCFAGSEKDPAIHQRIASEKYSPFQTMYFASFAGDILSAVTFHQKSGTADYGDANMKRVGNVAVGAWTVALFLAAATQGCTASRNVEEKVGPVTRAEVSRDRLEGQRKTFYLIHTLNMLPTLGYAIYSKRDDRWVWFGGILLMPALTDLVARYLFQSDDVSPWTLSGTFHDDGDHKTTPMLAWQSSW
jgi:hypothetical protein